MKRFVITKAQILHLLSTFVIVPVSGYVTAWVAKHFPGLPHFTPGQVQTFFLGGIGVALTAAIHYLHGWQVWERTLGRLIDVEGAQKPVNATGTGTAGGSVTGV